MIVNRLKCLSRGLTLQSYLNLLYRILSGRQDGRLLSQARSLHCKKLLIVVGPSSPCFVALFICCKYLFSPFLSDVQSLGEGRTRESPEGQEEEIL